MDRFIVGTGRCGSTLISRMVAEHPRVLMIQEFLAGLERRHAVSHEPIDGAAFATLLAYSNRLAAMPAARSREIPEGLLRQAPERFRESGMPTIMGIALPALSDDPLALYDAILAEVETWPRRHLAVHYRTLFEWLRDRFDRDVWIERSGISIEYLRELREFFPDARFLHIHRDGPGTALSMQRHPWFQLLVSFHFDPPTREELEQTELAGGTPSPDDSISRRLFKKQPPLRCFGEYWSYMIEMGLRELPHLDRSQYLDVRYEDLLADTSQELTRLATFFEIPADPGWLERAAKLSRSDKSPFDDLPPEDQRALLEACEPGEILLGRRNPPSFRPILEMIEEIQRT